MINRKPNELPFVSTKLDVDCMLLSTKPLGTNKDVLEFLSEKMYDNAIETSIAIFMDASLYPVCVASLGQGDTNSTPMSTRDVVHIGLLSNAVYVTIVHNHPIGSRDIRNFHPSEEDLLRATSIQKACSLCGIELIDFVITSGFVNKYGLTPAYYSMRDHNVKKMVKKLNLPKEKEIKEEYEFEWDFNGEEYWSYGNKLKDILKDNINSYDFLDH